jgi:hypothetical protein
MVSIRTAVPNDRSWMAAARRRVAAHLRTATQCRVATYHCAVACILVFVASGPFHAAKPVLAGDEPSPEVAVLLRNGNVLFGRVQEGLGWIRIEQSPKDHVRVATAEVCCWAPDVRGLYSYKRDRRDPQDLDAFFRDIRWSIRHKLFDLAAEDLVQASRLAPGHPQLRSLEQLLRDTHEQSLRAASSTGSSAVRADDQVRPVHAIERRDTLVPFSTASSAPDSTSTEGVPASAVMSEAAVRSFARDVQPLLLSGCAAAGCHGSVAENQLRLQKPPVGQLANAHATVLNLRTVLQYLDRTQPSASPLLTYAGPGHETRQLSPSAEQLLRERIERWMKQHVPKPAAAAAAPTSPSPQPTAGQKSAEPSSAVSHHSSGPAKPTPLPPVEDPFDPEIFNRRFHSSRIVQEGSSTSDG